MSAFVMAVVAAGPPTDGRLRKRSDIDAERSALYDSTSREIDRLVQRPDVDCRPTGQSNSLFLGIRVISGWPHSGWPPIPVNGSFDVDPRKRLAFAKYFIDFVQVAFWLT
ncbi:MAG TPA: hypothetical protein VG055_04320 [Planctomycetaceae bacterium]|jgi:hypothetical protein|nr:hypothetical protein [Planctomycetaceae bacterium]